MRIFQKAVLITSTLSAVASPAWAGPYALNVAPSGTQTVRFDRGISSVDSRQRASMIRVVNVAGTENKSVSFVIGVTNTSDRPFTFGPENITVRVNGAKTVALTTYEGAMEAERKREGHERFWSRVAAAGRGMSAANAGTSYSSGMYNGTASGYAAGAPVNVQTNGSYSGTTYDPGAALAAQRQAQELNAADRAALEQRWAARSGLADNLIRTTTVDRGMMYGGFANFAISADLRQVREPVEITIEVNVGGDRHIFTGRLSKSS